VVGSLPYTISTMHGHMNIKHELQNNITCEVTELLLKVHLNVSVFTTKVVLKLCQSAHAFQLHHSKGYAVVMSVCSYISTSNIAKVMLKLYQSAHAFQLHHHFPDTVTFWV
jgi:hypothetical protein